MLTHSIGSEQHRADGSVLQREYTARPNSRLSLIETCSDFARPSLARITELEAQRGFRFEVIPMSGEEVLLRPSECALLLVDMQAGLGFGVESASRQVLINNAVALAKTAVAFDVPVIATTSATKVYSGPMFPQLQNVLTDVRPTERKSMNPWEDPATLKNIKAAASKKLLIAGFLTEACVSFPALSALEEGYDVYVVGDTCGGLTLASHDLALRRLQQAGAHLTSWIQLLLEFQRDWTRHETYEAARAIVVENGGGYGMGLAYAREMIQPPLTPLRK
jgi:nicotinamidase-related amidase